MAQKTQKVRAVTRGEDLAESVGDWFVKWIIVPLVFLSIMVAALAAMIEHAPWLFLVLIAAVVFWQWFLYRSFEYASRARYYKLAAFADESDQARLSAWAECREEVVDLLNSGISEEDVRRQVLLNDKYERAVAMSVLDFMDGIPAESSRLLRLLGFYKRLTTKWEEEYDEALHPGIR